MLTIWFLYLLTHPSISSWIHYSMSSWFLLYCHSDRAETTGPTLIFFPFINSSTSWNPSNTFMGFPESCFNTMILVIIYSAVSIGKVTPTLQSDLLPQLIRDKKSFHIKSDVVFLDNSLLNTNKQSIFNFSHLPQKIRLIKFLAINIIHVIDSMIFLITTIIYVSFVVVTIGWHGCDLIRIDEAVSASEDPASFAFLFKCSTHFFLGNPSEETLNLIDNLVYFTKYSFTVFTLFLHQY